MDVRYSTEQRDLRDAAAHIVDRLGPRAVGQLEDAERAARLDAAVAGSGWRGLRTGDGTGAPWASGVEVAIVAEALGRGLADVAFLGPTLAADLRRLAGASEASAREAVAAAASAKAYASRAAMTVHEIAIQVHGGIGNTWECLAHVFLRRALLASDLAGGVGPNLSRVLEHAGLGGAR